MGAYLRGVKSGLQIICSFPLTLIKLTMVGIMSLEYWVDTKLHNFAVMEQQQVNEHHSLSSQKPMGFHQEIEEEGGNNEYQ